MTILDLDALNLNLDLAEQEAKVFSCYIIFGLRKNCFRCQWRHIEWRTVRSVVQLLSDEMAADRARAPSGKKKG